ncbi:hypothetical protein GHT06_016888 [Daphnia sinensis]|uniref:Uncharacterized protein n=1 Tax=Daphnia sinensis TaxID=1820382 RepID=A0AAD5L868_9CRUS|nr:hypothetical protein GHT06_016888 [Daphnia sinensis]
MSSFVKFSAKVIGAVAVGAGVAAVGWFGWKAYVEARAPVVQFGDADEAKAGHALEEDNIVPPQDAEKVDAVPDAPAPEARKVKLPKALWKKSYQRRLARRARERLALQQVAADESCCALALPVVPADVEEVPASASTVEPASEEHSAVPVQHVDEVTPAEQLVEVVGEEVVAAVADAPVEDVPVRPVRVKNPNKALWNKSYQRRLARRAQERAERAALQQVTGEDASPGSALPLESEVQTPPAVEVCELPAPTVEAAEVNAIADAVEVPVPPVRVKHPNKALWNKSYQRRLARRAKEREERAAQQAEASGEQAAP